MQIPFYRSERGFVLPTALAILSLLSLMAIAMYFTGRASIHVSSGAQHSTEGHYYAETAVNYMIWAMRNDAEFDSFDYGAGAPFAEPTSPVDAATKGDWSELMYNLSKPGPTDISDSTTEGTSGQVLYYDNTALSSRTLVWPLPTSGGDTVYPTLYNISASLPRYIRLDIDLVGNVTPAIPALPHAALPVIGTDIPDNGAIVWLTTGNSAMDFEVDPNLGSCSGTPPLGAVACDKNHAKHNPDNNPNGWLNTIGTLAKKEDQYGVVVYAIGYVGGRPSSIIRAQIK